MSQVAASPDSLAGGTQPETGLEKETGLRYATLNRGGATYVRREDGRAYDRWRNY